MLVKQINIGNGSLTYTTWN